MKNKEYTRYSPQVFEYIFKMLQHHMDNSEIYKDKYTDSNLYSSPSYRENKSINKLCFEAKGCPPSITDL